MESNWSTVKLEEVLEQVIRPEEVMLGEHYKVLGSKWYAKGLYIKSEKDGSEIKAKKLYVVKEGDFVYNRLFAWKGSFAIVPNEFDGCYVSNEFPSFRIDTKQIHLRYLLYFFSRNEIWSKVLSLSMGVSSINRNRLNVEKLLSMEIPLPSREEQKRIVARIESMMARIEVARKLRAEAVEEAEGLLLEELRIIFSDDSTMSFKKTVEELCSKPQYGFTDSAKYEPVGPKFLRITDIQNGRVNWKQVPYSSCPEKDKYLLQSGDILFARSGATTGKSFFSEVAARIYFCFVSYPNNAQRRNIVRIPILVFSITTLLVTCDGKDRRFCSAKYEWQKIVHGSRSAT
jgi:type I restriction enzyme S subunit